MPICPLIALSASGAVNATVKSRGFADLAHLLYPFSTHNVTVNEPSTTQSVSSELRIDLRDISKDGHLLTLSVLPYVLAEALKSSENLDDGLERLVNSIHRWAEPSEHEALGVYTACIFAVSSADENPMSQLSQLIQNQQTLHSPAARDKAPGHCCPPRWVSPNTHILKHYVLVHDQATTDQQRANGAFDQMCSTYGKENCQILNLSDATTLDPSLTHRWDEVDLFEQFLRKGVHEASTLALADSTASSSVVSSAASTPSVQSSISTISSVLPSSAVVLPSPEYSQRSQLQSKPSFDEERRFSTADATACNEFLKRFITTSLIPSVERLMRQLQDQVNARRGIISKSFTSSMKKLFAGGSSAAQTAAAAATTYDWDSVEMQTRRLADLAFLFGLHNVAYQQYRVVKKDFNSDQSAFANAVSSEMCAYALYLAQPSLNSKQFPLHYIDTAVTFLTEPRWTHNVPKPLTSILRCAFHTSQVQEHLELHKEAAQNLARLTCLDQDFLVAAAQAEAAEQFVRANMPRKAAFFRVLAANRFATANMPHLAFDCYRLAMPTFDPIHWGIMDEHVSLKLLTEGSKEMNGKKLLTPNMAMECARRLMVVCSKISALSPQLVASRMAFVVRVLSAYTPHDQYADILDILTLDSEQTEVVCGELPAWSEVAMEHDADVAHDTWNDVQRAAHHAVHGPGAPFRGVQLVSNKHTQNEKVRETPAGEKYRVRVHMNNALPVIVNLSGIHLEVATEDPNSVTVAAVETSQLQPKETAPIELYVIPKIGCKRIKITGIRFQLHGEEGSMVSARIPLVTRGKRLNKTLKQQKAKVYAADERLSANVAEGSWPLLSVRSLKKPVTVNCYCDQAHRYLFDVENVGNEPVEKAALATNGYDCVAAGIVGADGKRIHINGKKSANSDKVSTFELTSPTGTLLDVGQRLRLFIDVRAMSTECLTTVPSLLKDSQRRPPTILILNYKGSTSGASRQWRKVVKMTCRRLIALEASVLDESRKMIAIRVHNQVQQSQAALSKVQVLRIRLSRQPFQETTKLPMISDVSSSRVELESDQSETVCMTVAGEAEAPPQIWLSDRQQESVVDWPAPQMTCAADNEDNPLTMDEHHELRYTIGVLWRASVVNNEGGVNSFVGESFVLSPLYSTMAARNPKEEESRNLLHIECSAPKSIDHDFVGSALCEIPVEVKVKNTDAQHRTARVSLRFVPKLKEPVAGVHVVPPESRQQLWVNRPVQHATLKESEEKTFRMNIRMCQASVYDVGTNHLQVEAQFDGVPAGFTFKVPRSLTVINST